MNKKKVVIVNRGFWPLSDVPGGSLLALAEELSLEYKTFVLAQSNLNIQKIYSSKKSHKSVQINSCRSLTDSNSKVIYRIFETIYFTIWTLFKLIRIQPKFIYIATDPPLILPFAISIYSRIFKAEYTYHLQDIHPEASKKIINSSYWAYKILIIIDNYTLRYAKSIVTLTKEMADYINIERKISKSIYLIDNASLYPKKGLNRSKNTIIFCGNAGRLQEIPLLTASIDLYLKRGGILKFTFLGSGIYTYQIEDLAKRWSNVSYLGYFPFEEAIEILSQHEWAILPIKDEVLKYAFPSKTSAYLAAGCKILAICSKDTSLSRWVNLNKCGVVSDPEVEKIVDMLFLIEKNKFEIIGLNNLENLKKYSYEKFSEKLKKIIT